MEKMKTDPCKKVDNRKEQPEWTTEKNNQNPARLTSTYKLNFNNKKIQR